MRVEPQHPRVRVAAHEHRQRRDGDRALGCEQDRHAPGVERVVDLAARLEQAAVRVAQVVGPAARARLARRADDPRVEQLGELARAGRAAARRGRTCGTAGRLPAAPPWLASFEEGRDALARVVVSSAASQLARAAARARRRAPGPACGAARPCRASGSAASARRAAAPTPRRRRRARPAATTRLTIPIRRASCASMRSPSSSSSLHALRPTLRASSADDHERKQADVDLRACRTSRARSRSTRSHASASPSAPAST